MLIRKLLLPILCSTIFPVVAHSDPYSEDYVKEMCERMYGQIETASTLSNLGVENIPINTVFKVTGQDLDEMMLDSYELPSYSVNSSEQLNEELENSDNTIIVLFEENSTNSTILLGHTMKNPDVVKVLRDMSIIYANFSYTDNDEIWSSRKGLMRELKAVPTSLIFSSKNESGAQEIAGRLVSNCVRPSELITWLNGHASNNGN